MITLKYLTSYLDNLLNSGNIPDDSLNGLQFPGRKKIKKIAIAVDACKLSIEKAADLHCDMLIVHHGIFWSYQGAAKVDENLKSYYKPLLKANLSLYASHLPLDMHGRYGNNAGLISLLGGHRDGSFCPYKGNKIGYYSKSFHSVSLGELMLKLSEILDLKKISIMPKSTSELLDIPKKDFPILNQKYKKKVGVLGVVSGGGSDGLNDLTKARISTFLTGEVPQYAVIKARESKVNLIVAGHYKTETVGIKLLAKHLEKKFELQSVFIDFPTGV